MTLQTRTRIGFFSRAALKQTRHRRWCILFYVLGRFNWLSIVSILLDEVKLAGTRDKRSNGLVDVRQGDEVVPRRVTVSPRYLIWGKSLFCKLKFNGLPLLTIENLVASSFPEILRHYYTKPSSSLLRVATLLFFFYSFYIPIHTNKTSSHSDTRILCKHNHSQHFFYELI